jgi:hypothetical protein
VIPTRLTSQILESCCSSICDRCKLGKPSGRAYRCCSTREFQDFRPEQCTWRPLQPSSGIPRNGGGNGNSSNLLHTELSFKFALRRRKSGLCRRRVDPNRSTAPPFASGGPYRRRLSPRWFRPAEATAASRWVSLAGIGNDNAAPVSASRAQAEHSRGDWCCFLD